MAHEFDGEKYRKSSTHQKQWGERLISEFDFRGDERILDLGCGDGVLTASLAELVPGGYALGIDASKGMIETAKKIKADNLRFEILDINQLDFESEFDLVFSNAALHWLMNHRLLLKNVKKALKNDGILRFNFAAKGNCPAFFEIVRGAMNSEKFKKHFSGFEWPWYMPSLGRYKKLLVEQSFKEIKVWGERIETRFPDAEAMIGWLDQPSLVPIIKHVADDGKTEFREYIIKQMIDNTRQADGSCIEIFQRINVFAKK
jgi:trans-aconitate 2-methyltransferase